MPSNFNSRVQTQSSAVLTEELAEAGGMLAIEAGALVPVAARYKTHTPDQISSTQPIPDHIVSTDRETDQNNELVIPPLDGSGQAAGGLIDERSTTRDSRVN